MSGVRLLGAVLLLAACESADTPETGSPCGPSKAVITHVVDGDTADLDSGVRIRYLGVDTPETKGKYLNDPMCGGVAAETFNRDRVEGREVRLEYDAACTDHYGRTLAYVFVGDAMVNLEILERGHAEALIMRADPNVPLRYEEELLAAESLARNAPVGIWANCP